MQKRDANGLTEQEFLAAYRPGDYVRPSVACDMVIFTVTDTETSSYRKNPDKELRVLLIERGGHPCLGEWALPGGFVNPNENTEHAAKRELKEEAGVENIYLEQLYTFSDPNRDPRTWVMSCSYMALVDSANLRIQAGDDADKAAWFQLSFKQGYDDSTEFLGGVRRIRRYALELTSDDTRLSAIVEHSRVISKNCSEEDFRIVENNGLAFDHAKILTYALLRLQGKLDYSGIVMHLMPELFTLSELQRVYEVILGKTLLKAAFRRKIAPLVTETEQFTQNAGHRPSRLYKVNWQGIR